ncbi:DUF6502 family protein [Piscinibacter sp. HJYY11]|uniref:DUF6502 family protein n=1 Tax=Piscinibacter sp. HJYY11 TaxID=2801333 RepID=UPI00191F6F8F|nr:DUF6502 family protein [Piscinibacter sp. HJYY11]MBL0728820.1 hypothetical protein [Piscinibacter sp. HJYY11]
MFVDDRSLPPAPSAAPDTSAVLAACRALLTPLAQLAIARGLHHADLDELLRAAFVDAALAAHPDASPHRAASRVSTATGLNRREVTRLLQREPVAEARRTPATQVFTRWLSDPAWHAHTALPRQGAGASFEALAQSVTKDVHPRSLLEELCRLGLARVDEAKDLVELLRERFAPAGDEPRMLGFLASNVGDHLHAAVTNVVSPEPQHLEQAVFADELSTESVQRLQPLVREQWQQLLRTLAPAVQKAIDEDARLGRPQDQRLRVGLYGYHAPMHDAAPAASATPGDTPTSAEDSATRATRRAARKATRRSST